ncbi:MAG: hypothetical protein ACP5O6_05800 [Candidatus Baltobacteraceae bacterium]
MSAETIDGRLAHLEGAYDQISDRLNGFDQRFASLEGKIDGLRTEMNHRFATIDARFAAIERRFSSFDQKFNLIFGLIAISILIPLLERYLLH